MTTQQMLNQLKLDQELMKKDFKNLCDNNETQHEEIKDLIFNLNKTVAEFIASSDYRFASRRFQRMVEKILWGLAIFVATYIGTKLIGLL